jgi:hypothetical protein
VLSLSVRDLADMALDGESRHGGGLGERTLGAAGGISQNAEGDIGGIDCSFKPSPRHRTKRGAARRFNGLRRGHAAAPRPPPT